jgi:hypothetical protein
MRGWACHFSEVSVFVSCLYRIIYIGICSAYCQSRLCEADYAVSLLSLCYDGNLVTCTVVSLTAAKFKALILSVLGFTLSYIVNIWVNMILYDFLVPA